MGRILLFIATIVVIAISAVRGGGFGTREGCEERGGNGLFAKHCYDVLDEAGECLPDDIEWFEEECSRTVDDPGYAILRQYQEAIDECFADPQCTELPYDWSK